MTVVLPKADTLVQGGYKNIVSFCFILDSVLSKMLYVLYSIILQIAAGQMMEQGPVLVITFNAQQVMVIRDRLGKVVEGDPDKIIRMFYVWALCRDQTILDPQAAWRIVDLSSSPSEQWL